MAIKTERPKKHVLQFLGFPAHEDLSGHQNRFVALTAESAGGAEVQIVGSAGDVVIGVLDNAPASGEMASVAVEGVTQVEAAGALNTGVEIMADTDGKATTATGAGKHIRGITLEAASGAGHIILIRLVDNRVPA